MLLPSVCPVCLAAGAAPCESCAQMLRPAPGLPLPPGLDRCDALLAYDDLARALLTGLKRANRRSSVAWLADGLAGLRVPSTGSVVTWAPTTADRARGRGFDQAELLARAVARQVGRALPPACCGDGLVPLRRDAQRPSASVTPASRAPAAHPSGSWWSTTSQPRARLSVRRLAPCGREVRSRWRVSSPPARHPRGRASSGKASDVPRLAL